MMRRSANSPASIVLPANFRRRPQPQATANPLRAASVGAIAAALLLVLSYYGNKSGWPSVLPNPIKFFRNDTVAQAAPGLDTTAPRPVPNSVDPMQSQTVETSLSDTSEDTSEQSEPPLRAKEKKRERSRVQQQSQDTAKSRTSTRAKDRQEKQSQQQSAQGSSSLDNRNELGTLESALPGKILYKVPLDPTANRDRLFDD
jgi:hypothetical protein